MVKHQENDHWINKKCCRQSLIVDKYVKPTKNDTTKILTDGKSS